MQPLLTDPPRFLNFFHAQLFIVGIFIFISRDIFMLSMFNKNKFANLSNLRFISGTYFMLSWVEHEETFYNSEREYIGDVLIVFLYTNSLLKSILLY